MRLLILAYAGDYREAVQRFARNGAESYNAQKHTVESVANLVTHLESVTFLCCVTDESYNELLENGVRAIGAGFKTGAVDEQKLIYLIEQQNPTHLVIYPPLRKVFQWAVRNNVKTLGILGESIVVKNWRDRLRTYHLVRLLNQPTVEWVGSYGLATSKRLQTLGVNPNKIVPWDLLMQTSPGTYEPKTLDNRTPPFSLIYVGSLYEAKGVGDVLRAVAALRDRQFPVRLKLVGRDIDDTFAKLAQTLNITDIVDFLGIISPDEVETRMRETDVVLVPSHHEYTEGFPQTIHHAMCARTPVIASDHPMFREHLEHKVNCVIFPAKDHLALAASIESLLNDRALYARLSEGSYNAWHQLRLPVKWRDLLDRWVFSSPENQQWLYNHRLAADCYQKMGRLTTTTHN